MNVLHISLSTYPGSKDKNAGIFVRKLLDLQIEKGLNSYLLVGSPEWTRYTKNIFDIMDNKYIVARYQRGIGRSLFLQKLIFRKMAERFSSKMSFKPDIIHCHYGTNSLIGQQFSKSFNCPYIVTFHENPPQFQKFLSQAKKIEREAVLNSSLVTRPNPNDLHKLCKFGVSKKKVVYHQNYVDDRLFKIPNKEKKIDLRKKMKVMDKRVVINVASLVKIKGHELLIKAFYLLHKRDPNTELWLIGNGPLRENLSSMIKKMKMEDTVRFIGEINNEKISEYLYCADIFAMPSISESFGISQVEGMLTGLPVVATHNYGSEDIIIENVNGYLCNSRNPKDFANLLKKALENRWDKEKVRETAVDRYGSDAVFHKLNNIYLKVKKSYKIN